VHDPRWCQYRVNQRSHGWGDARRGALREPPFDLVGSGFAGPTSAVFVRPRAACFDIRPSGESERTNEVEALVGGHTPVGEHFGRKQPRHEFDLAREHG
jgi:hypothetical protein